MSPQTIPPQEKERPSDGSLHFLAVEEPSEAEPEVCFFTLASPFLAQLPERSSRAATLCGMTDPDEHDQFLMANRQRRIAARERRLRDAVAAEAAAAKARSQQPSDAGASADFDLMANARESKALAAWELAKAHEAKREVEGLRAACVKAYSSPDLVSDGTALEDIMGSYDAQLVAAEDRIASASADLAKAASNIQYFEEALAGLAAGRLAEGQDQRTSDRGEEGPSAAGASSAPQPESAARDQKPEMGRLRLELQARTSIVCVEHFIAIGHCSLFGFIAGGSSLAGKLHESEAVARQARFCAACLNAMSHSVARRGQQSSAQLLRENRAVLLCRAGGESMGILCPRSLWLRAERVRDGGCLLFRRGAHR